MGKLFYSYLLISSKINEVRGKPILQLFMSLEAKFMVNLQHKFTKAGKWESSICPKALDRLNKNIQDSRQCQVLHSGRGEFLVICKGTRLVVRLDDRYCLCNEWQISGIPCSHACAAIGWKKDDPKSYVDPFFSKDTYIKAYSEIIRPAVDPIYWKEDDCEPIGPPPLKRQPGRPTKNRRRNEGETEGDKKRKRPVGVICGNCKYPGHNKRHCQRAPTAREAQQMHNKRPSAASPSRPPRKRRAGSTGGSSSGGASNVTVASEERTRRNTTTASEDITRRKAPTASIQVPPRRCSARLNHDSVEVRSSQGATTSTTRRSISIENGLRRSTRVSQCLGTQESQVLPK